MLFVFKRCFLKTHVLDRESVIKKCRLDGSAIYIRFCLSSKTSFEKRPFHNVSRICAFQEKYQVLVDESFCSLRIFKPANINLAHLNFSASILKSMSCLVFLLTYPRVVSFLIRDIALQIESSDSKTIVQ